MLEGGTHVDEAKLLQLPTLLALRQSIQETVQNSLGHLAIVKVECLKLGQAVEKVEECLTRRLLDGILIL